MRPIPHVPGGRAAAWPDEDDEYRLTDADFQRIAQLLHALAGIVLEPHKRQMITSRLSRRMRAGQYDSYSRYLDAVEANELGTETQDFVNALTTNLTSFFREAHHFDHLEQAILVPAKAAHVKRLRIWSAGCSSGEEPYSIAMTAVSVFGTPPTDLRILATDLDTNVLEKAKRGEYPADKCSGVPERFARYFERNETPDSRVLARRARDLITFRQLNLMEDWPMSGPFDAVFCRNVMIYFDMDAKTKLLDRFAKLLRPGGYLYLGHSEAILGQHPLLSSIGVTIYQRRGT